MTETQTCPDCKGAGSVQDPVLLRWLDCRTCQGIGKVPVIKVMSYEDLAKLYPKEEK